MKTITLNGLPRELPADVGTIHELLDHLAISDRIMVIEQNREILDKSKYDAPIKDRDQIEIIHFVGGG